MDLRAHYKPIGIASATTLTIFISYYFHLGWNWIELGIFCSFASFALCYPKKLANMIRHFLTRSIPNAATKVWNVVSHLNLLLTAIAWIFSWLSMMLNVFLAGGILISGSYNDPKVPPLIPWYVTLPTVFYLAFYVYLLIHEVSMDEEDSSKTLTGIDFLRDHDNWRNLWVIVLATPGIGHVLGALVMLPYLLIGLGIGIEKLWHAGVCIFATLYVSWNSREELVCISDGFISVFLTKIYVVQDLDTIGLGVLALSFLIGYGVGFVHYNLLKPLLFMFKPYVMKLD